MTIEFAWLKNIDFFPSRQASPATWKKTPSICIATKSRNMGDAMALTTLPKKLKAQFPELEIYTYPRAFNPIVFKYNPHISGVSYLPDAVYGDDANWGWGQLIQLKESFFELPISSPPRPELYLDNSEKRWAEHLLATHRTQKNHSKPLCLIHPWGATRNQVASLEFWNSFVTRWNHAYCFWQVGLESHARIPACAFHLLLPRAAKYARKLFALMSRAKAFIGVDSGPMHVAKAFDVPSLILVDHANPEGAFLTRKQSPYFLHQNWIFSPLYEENTHINVRTMQNHAILKEMDVFFER
jgi:hypothetical protein